MQDQKGLSATTYLVHKFLPQKKKSGSRGSLYTSYASDHLSLQELLVPQQLLKEKRLHREESIKIISYRSNKTLLLRTPLSGITCKL